MSEGSAAPRCSLLNIGPSPTPELYIKKYAVAQVRLHSCDAMRLSGRRGTTEESGGRELIVLLLENEHIALPVWFFFQSVSVWALLGVSGKTCMCGTLLV